jgi:dipeptidase E
MAKQRTIVLYSGGQESSNARLHDALAELAGNKTQKSMTYIPYISEGSRYFYQRAIRRYRKHGFTVFHRLIVDEPITPYDMNEAFKSDVIYLAGGNTFYFLKHLRKSGILPRLKKYVKDGGILAGLSAGAIIMTPHIGLAAFPEWDADENDVKLKNLTSLGLVQFEFYPHFEDTRRANEAMIAYSKRSKLPIYACEDGHGVIITGDRTTFVGSVYLFINGKKVGFNV